MEANVWEPCHLEEWREGSLPEVSGIYERAFLCREDKALISIEVTDVFYLPYLASLASSNRDNTVLASLRISSMISAAPCSPFFSILNPCPANIGE